jgi:RHS repeat-associated protein
MPGRKYPAAGGLYRYGFNGKEKSDEVYGDGNVYDYGFRIYDPRIGKFLSTDPLFKSYPELTPYQFASNCPIEAIDLDGLEAESSKKDGFWKAFGKSVLRGVGNAISYVANNPNHAGYGNGVQPSTGKPPTQAEFQRYDFSITQQFDPHYQIENLSNNLVYGTYNFVGGIIDGDGARTAQAIPPLLDAIGTVAGIRRFGASKNLKIPQGLSGSEFQVMSQRVVNAVKNISDDVVVQGSRASGTATIVSDIDIAVKMGAKEFDQAIVKAFGTPNKGSALERTMQHAMKTGKIQAGEAGLSGVRKNLEKLLGMKVDISIIKKGGAFDNGAQIPVKGVKTP